MLRQQQIGIVILTTMIMISILTMLVLSLTQTVFLYIKVSNHVVAKHESLYQLETAAYHLFTTDYPRDCLFTEEDPNRIVDFLLHNKGCSFLWKGRQYYYLADDLGIYPCLQVMSGSEIKSSHHWLITVFSPVPQPALLQLRVAKSVKAINCHNPHQIKMGVISWRYYYPS